MLASTFLMIFKVVAVMVLLGAMVAILVGIRHIMDADNPADADQLRKEVQDNDDVISSNSLFSRFLAPRRDDSGSDREARRPASRRN